jgi:hypothetical protein
MRTKLLLLSVLVTMNVFAQDKLSIPGFGDLPVQKNGDKYAIDFGKLGKFNFSGTINPLSLSTAIEMDDLKFFPGAKVLAALGLQDIELTLTGNDLEIAANIEDKFKDDILDEIAKIDIIQPVIGEIKKTLDIRDSKASLKFDKNMDIHGLIDLKIYIFGAKLPIPQIKGKIDPKAIVNTIVEKVKDVALNEIAKVGKLVADAAVQSGKAIAGAMDDAMKIAKTASKHATHSKSDCDKGCVPAHAKKMSEKIHWAGNNAMCVFYDNVMPVLINIQGKSKPETAQLRKKYIDQTWNQITAKIDNDWKRVRGDDSYIRFYIMPSSATNGGKIFRAKVDDYKNSHLTFRNEIYDRLLNDTKVDGLIENYWPNVKHNAEVRLRNKWKKTFINIEKGTPACTEAGSAWASAKWVFEKVPGSDVVRIKNVWKGTYLNIETGKLACTPMAIGMHSSHWVIEEVPGQNSVRIRNRWKNTLYLHVENGKLDCSTINFAWHSAMWNLGYVRYPIIPKPDVATNKQVRLTNVWKKTSVNVETGSAKCGNIAPGWLSAKWVFERVPNTEFVRIKNVWKGTYLHIENGKVESTKIGAGAQSAMWHIQKVPNSNYYYIKNRWKNTYLHIERGKLECGDIAPGWLSAKWILDFV